MAGAGTSDVDELVAGLKDHGGPDQERTMKGLGLGWDGLGWVPLFLLLLLFSPFLFQRFTLIYHVAWWGSCLMAPLTGQKPSLAEQRRSRGELS